uniref:Uncharacterized protein n=1 Tax=Meloidogyne javanica TaxID=6303 RepID=A0A915N7H5_MELJA
MSKDNLITACAFVNDKNNFVLQKVFEHLTTNSNENNSSSTILHLNTKYYICDVPVFNFNSFEDFTENQSKQKDENLFLALIVCAFLDEINEHFLDKLSKISQIESLDVKTLIIKNWTNSEGFDNKLNSIPFDFAKLNKFALTHNIEIINVFNEGSNNQPNDSDDDEEEMGTKGIARIVEEFPLSTYSQHQGQYNNTQNMSILRIQPESIQQQNIIRRRFDGTNK